MTKALWQLEDIVQATGGRLEAAAGQAAQDGAVGGVSIDTRTIGKDDLFVALLGDNSDGHAYVDKAFAAGAGAALVGEGRDVPASHGALVRVSDTLVGLNALGVAARTRCDGRIIGVTGSAGKTGTKEALRLCLGVQGATHAAEKSYNNHWGVPLTLARMPADTTFGVFEIGMNHAGEIRPLVKMVRPHVAIVTTVAPVHIGHFGSLDEIAQAKSEIFEGLEPGGTAIINRDNAFHDHLRRVAEKYAGRIISFGAHPDAEAQVLEARLGPEGSRIKADICGTAVTFDVATPGAHIVMNALAVLAAVHAVGADVVAAAGELSVLKAPVGRGSREHLRAGEGAVLLVDESYNANPASMRAALSALSQTLREHHPRRIAVLGDMLELGEQARQMHLELAEPIEEAGIDLVFACGPQMKALYDALPAERRGGYAADSKGLEPLLVDMIAAGDAVMVKGSLGSNMAPIVSAVRARFAKKTAPS